MTVIKFPRDGGPFARIPNETAQDTRLCAEGLAVIAYFGSKPENFCVRDYELKKRFNWGRDRRRKVWAELEKIGYAEIKHRQPLGGGKIGTTITIAVKPVFNQRSTGGGSTVTGESGSGSAVDGDATTLKRKGAKEGFKKKVLSKNKPAAKGGGKVANESDSEAEIENTVGFRLPLSVVKLGEPIRVGHILFREKLSPEAARTVIAAFDAEVASGTVSDPWALLATLARRAKDSTLRLSAAAEKRLPPWI